MTARAPKASLWSRARDWATCPNIGHNRALIGGQWICGRCGLVNDPSTIIVTERGSLIEVAGSPR